MKGAIIRSALPDIEQPSTMSGQCNTLAAIILKGWVCRGLTRMTSYWVVIAMLLTWPRCSTSLLFKYLSKQQLPYFCDSLTVKDQSHFGWVREWGLPGMCHPLPWISTDAFCWIFNCKTAYFFQSFFYKDFSCNFFLLAVSPV